VIAQVGENHAAFAARVGLSPDKLWKSLSGSRRFTSPELALVARESGVSVDWLLTGTMSPSSAIARRSSSSTKDGFDVTAVTDRFANAYEVLSIKGRHRSRAAFDYAEKNGIIARATVDVFRVAMADGIASSGECWRLLQQMAQMDRYVHRMIGGERELC
jgi:hypothetical protein